MKTLQATDDVRRSRWIWGVTLGVPVIILVMGLMLMFYFHMVPGG
jgi:hypothetical protein